LAELRERRALTLRELSEVSGVAADTINQIELGHRKPRPSTLRKLARALEVDVEEFYREPALPLADAPLAGLPDPEELDNIEELDYWRQEVRARAKKAIEKGQATGWQDNGEQRAKIFALLKKYDKRRHDLDPPLATIVERGDLPTEIIYHRPATPEEQAKLRADYPNAIEFGEGASTTGWTTDELAEKREARRQKSSGDELARHA